MGISNNARRSKEYDRRQKDLSTDTEQRVSDLLHHVSSEMFSMRCRTYEGPASKGREASSSSFSRCPHKAVPDGAVTPSTTLLSSTLFIEALRDDPSTLSQANGSTLGRGSSG